MSELNVYHHELRHNEYAEFYLKYEADKVIAEKDKLITYAQALVLEDIKLIRRHKYKRCFAMAIWCSAELGMLVSTLEFKIKHYKKWHKRWLELAEKFKDGN